MQDKYIQSVVITIIFGFGLILSLIAVPLHIVTPVYAESNHPASNTVITVAPFVQPPQPPPPGGKDGADLVVTVTGSPDPVLLGQTISYDIIITNNGTITATGIKITDSFSSGFRFVGISDTGQTAQANGNNIGCRMVGINFICDIAVPLPVSNSISLNLGFTPLFGGLSVNTVDVSANQPDPNKANNHAVAKTMVISASADLSIIQQNSASSVVVGNAINYTMTVKNNGPAQADGITVIAPFSAEALFGAVKTSQGICNLTTDIVSCALSSLSSGTQVTVTLTVTPTTVGVISNTVTIAASFGIDPNVSNNQSSTTTRIRALQTNIDRFNSNSLIYTDIQNNPTTLFVPAGAVSSPISLVFVPVTSPNTANLPGAYAEHSFLLDVHQQGSVVPNYIFQNPISVTIKYSDADTAGMDKNKLFLYYFDQTANSWVDATTTCATPSAYQYNININQVTAFICGTGQFVLAGVNVNAGINMTYLPVILKQSQP